MFPMFRCLTIRQDSRFTVDIVAGDNATNWRIRELVNRHVSHFLTPSRLKPPTYEIYQRTADRQCIYNSSARNSTRSPTSSFLSRPRIHLFSSSTKTKTKRRTLAMKQFDKLHNVEQLNEKIYNATAARDANRLMDPILIDNRGQLKARDLRILAHEI